MTRAFKKKMSGEGKKHGKWEEKQRTEDRVSSPNRKTAKKQGKKNALKKKQLRLVQPENFHYNHTTAFRTYCLWA
jgi:hypothetical protein